MKDAQLRSPSDPTIFITVTEKPTPFSFEEASKALCITEETSLGPERPVQAISYPSSIEIAGPDGSWVILKPAHTIILSTFLQASIPHLPLVTFMRSSKYQSTLEFGGRKGNKIGLKSKDFADLQDWRLIRSVDRGIYQLVDRAVVTGILAKAREGIGGQPEAAHTEPT
jgi:hypothetical protein